MSDFHGGFIWIFMGGFMESFLVFLGRKSMEDLGCAQHGEKPSWSDMWDLSFLRAVNSQMEEY